jgi:hypothetical protein
MMQGPAKAEESLPAKDDISKKEEMKKKIQPPPNSAPALMGASRKDKSVSGSPEKAPSSDKSKYCVSCLR